MSEETRTGDDRPVAELSYEQARDELVQIVATLEAGQLPLAESLRLWERGEQLAAHCSGWLDQAEVRLSGVKPNSDNLDEAFAEEDEAPTI